MSYTLVIGNKNYSSWSMRAWLLMKFVGVPFTEKTILLYTGQSRREARELGGETGLVPILIHGETIIWDTLAITEYLHERFSKVWPVDTNDRARARSYCGELHSGFNALREAMPVNARGRNRLAKRTPEVLADMERVFAIWSRAGRANDGPWLFGAFCAVDIMFAPVALRFQTYAVDVPADASPYYRALLNHPLVVEWQELGRNETAVIDRFELPEIA
jgi:glutathione S-transferase